MTTVKVKKQRPAKISKQVVELLEESARDDLIVTPAYNEFLVQWDESYPEHVVDRLREVLTTKQRDRRYSWSASQAGKCMRRQEFAFLGMPTVGQYDPQQRRIFLNGTWVHLRNQATLLSAGILDNIEVTVRKKSQRARCTMDGMGTAISGRYQGAEFGYELKSANDWAYGHQITKGVSEATRSQVDFEFLLTGLDLFVIFNENKNNQSINEWVILRDEERVYRMADQVKELNRAIDKQRLHSQLRECEKQLRSGEFYKCPYGGEGGVCASVGSWPSRVP
jgi:hypothetical protein